MMTKMPAVDTPKIVALGFVAKTEKIHFFLYLRLKSWDTYLAAGLLPGGEFFVLAPEDGVNVGE